MASVDLIDIVSTDSDSDFREIDNYRDGSSSSDTASSSDSRNLSKTWPSSSHSYPTDTIEPSASRPRGCVPGRVGSHNYGSSSTSHEIHSSYQPIKSMIPAALQPSSSSKLMNNAIENVGTCEAHETHAKSYQLTTLSKSSDGRNSLKGNFVWDNGHNLSVSEKKGNRSLPLSLMSGDSGLHASATPFIGLNDSFLHTGLGEEGYAGVDESFVFQAAVQDLHQPTMEVDLPRGLLSVSLLRHQKIALAWMFNRESSGGVCMGGILADDQGLGKTVSMIALIQRQRILEAKSKSKHFCSTRTQALNVDEGGGDDGNGGCVALDDARQMEESGDFAILSQASNALKGFHSKRPAAGTLIVCPASVLRQWAQELEEKVTKRARLTVLIYHGGNRTKNPATLAKYHVVLTTYAIVTNEVPKQPLVEEDDYEQKDGEQHGPSSAFSVEKKRKMSSGNKKSNKGKRESDMSAFDRNCGTLARVKWSRVVLDESQTIKNHRTQVARACCSLRAKRRWCLSGTPMQNSVDELFSYFRFLRYDPYDKYKVFASTIKGLISRDSAKGYKKLQVVLKNIMLRRTKGTVIDGKPIITLPPKKVELRRVDFTVEERTFYNKLEADSCKQFRAYAAAGTVNQNYANILLMLLRLRQACDHPLLVKGFSSDPVGKVSCEMAKDLPRELLVNLWRQLDTSLAICLVCRDIPENAVVTLCAHVFCYQCVSDHLTGEDNTCPAPECKEQLGADIVYSRSTLRRCLSDDIEIDASVSFDLDEKARVLQPDYISSKIKCSLELLKSHCISKSQNLELDDVVRYDEDASSASDLQLYFNSRQSEKAIVFSQWTCMLDLVEKSLKNSHISYRRLDGTMSIAARDKAVKDFNSEPEIDVMLMSLKAGNLGLNMVAACRIILLDLWWNPTTEDQAVDRAHRIGQTRLVTVSRITIKDTIEDRILALQEDKRKMVASAFGEDQSGGRATRLTVEDLKFLFEGSKASRY